jgi:membrane protease subunit HflC
MVLLVIAIVLFNSVTVSTYPDEYKLIKQFGAIVKIIDTPGWSFKLPVIQSTQSIPKYVMCYDLAPSSVNTSDKKIMNVDSFALWRVSDPMKYVTTLGANQVTAETRIDSVVYNSMKTVLSATSQEDIISGRDGKLADAITEKIGNSLESYGIDLIKVETKMLDLPDDNRESVYARMISERNNIAAGYAAQGESESKKIINETDKEVAIKRAEANAQAEQIKADGEAQYMEILSKAYNDADKADFYNYVRGLDTLKTTIKGSNKTIILDKDSEIAQMLLGIR